MTFPLLLEHFDELISTPKDVEKLNRSILQLAMQGKLVAQNPNDEPAIELLKQIKEEKAKEKKGKKSAVLPLIESNETPFDLPEGWEWVRLGELVNKMGAGSTPKGGKEVYTDEGTKFIRSQNVYHDGLRLDDVVYISDIINEKMSGTIVKAKDILLNITGASIARCALVPDDFDSANVNQHVMIIRMIEPEIRKFVHICMISPYIYNLIMSVQVGMSREGLSIGKLEKFILPFPPLPEQQRIVARVEELFAQTRLLSEELAGSRAELDRLNESALARLLASETPEEFNERWGFVAEHFDLLTSAPEHIAPLRQSILELAVRGKLTRREEGDESAKELLTRIKEEKEKLVDDGKIRKEKPLPPIKENEKPFELPKEWEWARIGSIAEIGTGSTPLTSRLDYYEDGTIPWVTSSATNQSYINEAEKHITEVAQSEVRLRLYPVNTLIVALYGQGKTRGQVSELLIPATINQACAALMFDGEASGIRTYAKLFFLKNYTELRALAEGGAQPNLNVGKIKNMPLPIPPFAEQEHIVKRVEQLLGWCDALEARLRSAEEVRGRLVESVLAGEIEQVKDR